MSVELPFAPVDTIIRGKAGELRVSAGAAEEADTDDRKTLMAADFGVRQVVPRRELELPIAPIDRIARLRIDNQYRVSMDARIALADILEDYANNVADAAAILARHADRRTIQAEDIETYFQLFE
jgi:histone H3/H4